MRIGVFPQGHSAIQQESAHLLAGTTVGFYCSRMRANLLSMTSDMGRQPLDLRLNRYPSPSKRSGPPWARPPRSAQADVAQGHAGKDQTGVMVGSTGAVPIKLAFDFGVPKAGTVGRSKKERTPCVLNLSFWLVWLRERLLAAATTWQNKPSSARVPDMPGQKSLGSTRKAALSLGPQATLSIARKTQANAKPHLTPTPVSTGHLIANRVLDSVGFFRLSDAAYKWRGDLGGRQYV